MKLRVLTWVYIHRLVQLLTFVSKASRCSGHCRAAFYSLGKISNCEGQALDGMSIPIPPPSQLREHRVKGAEGMLRARGVLCNAIILKPHVCLTHEPTAAEVIHVRPPIRSSQQKIPSMEKGGHPRAMPLAEELLAVECWMKESNFYSRA